MSFLRDDLAQLAAYQSPHLAEEAVTAPVLDPLDTNESPIDLPAELKAALANQYKVEIAANRYPDGDQLALKRAVLKYVASSGHLSSGSAHTSSDRVSSGTLSAENITAEDITAENITLGNGSDELIRSVIMATCLGNHGSILVASPTFSMYSILAKTLGVQVHDAGRKENFEVDIEAAQRVMESASVKGPAVRAVFMVHPNSPTGNALTPLELDWLKQLPKDVLVIVDEAYFEFSGHTTIAEALRRSNWLVTRTFSKAFRLAAHRVGYGIAHPEVIAALEKLRLPYNLPSFSQAAAQAALTHSEALLSQIPTLIAERDRLFQALQDHPYLQVWPSDSNFVYARMSDRGLAALEVGQQADGLIKMFTRLRDKGTLIRHTGGGLRISIGTAAENQRTLANIQQVLETKR